MFSYFFKFFEMNYSLSFNGVMQPGDLNNENPFRSRFGDASNPILKLDIAQICCFLRWIIRTTSSNPDISTGLVEKHGWAHKSTSFFLKHIHEIVLSVGFPKKKFQ